METARSISVDVIVKNFKKYGKFKSNKKINSLLSSYCKNILLNGVVTKTSHSVNCSSSKLAKVYGITDIIIKNIVSKNNLSSALITESTQICIISVQSEQFHHLTIDSGTPLEMGGLENEFRKLERLFLINKLSESFYPPVGILLYGPPGCGKTSFANSLAKKCGAAFYNVESSSILHSEYDAGAAFLKDIFQKAASLTDEGPVILFVDEIDAMCPSPEKASFGNRLLSNALISELDALHTKKISKLLVLAATNSIFNVDHRLRRPGRFDQEILINVPTESQRLSILKILTADLNISTDVSCDTLAKSTPGFVGADLRGLCEEAVSHAQNLQSCFLENPLQIRLQDFDFALHKIIPSLKKGNECVVDLKPMKWADIGGLTNVKSEIRQSLEWPLKYPEVLESMDIPPVKGILLFGPPGCCKTTLVKAAATSCNVSFLSLNGAQIFSAYVGESERLISQAFQKARALAPSILFFDEIESIVGKRQADVGNNRVQERILSTMLNEMDGVGNRMDFKLDSSSQSETSNQGFQKILESNYQDAGTKSPVDWQDSFPSNNNNSLRVIVVGATNRPDMLDAAILRPGRLDRHIYVPPPDEQARRAVLGIYSSKMLCNNVDIDHLVNETELYSGADLKNLCKEAGLQALRRQLPMCTQDRLDLTVTHKDFLLALDKVKPSLTLDMLQMYNK